MLLNTFYSLDVNNMVQSAGNFTMSCFIAKGSSETIRGGSFDLFKDTYETFYGKKFEWSNDWLLRLVGYIEGDGAILSNNHLSSARGQDKLNKTKSLRFVLTKKEGKILYDIRDTA